MDRYIHTHTLTRVAGLALPAVGTLAVEVVDQVDAVPAVLTGVVSAFVHVWREGAQPGRDGRVTIEESSKLHAPHSDQTRQDG